MHSVRRTGNNEPKLTRTGVLCTPSHFSAFHSSVVKVPARNAVFRVLRTVVLFSVVRFCSCSIAYLLVFVKRFPVGFFACPGYSFRRLVGGLTAASTTVFASKNTNNPGWGHQSVGRWRTSDPRGATLTWHTRCKQTGA
jgi:hypothetical protein